MTDSFPDNTQLPGAAAPNRKHQIVAALAGVGLFCVSGLVYPVGGSGWLAPFAYLYTPLFALPLTIVLWRQKQIRWLGGLYFLVGLTAFHFAAISVTSQIYSLGVTYVFECFGPQYEAPAAHHACEQAGIAARTHNAPRAGGAGGLTGAALSFGGLVLLGSRFRQRKKIAVMIAVTLALGAIGAAGMSFTFPDKMRAWQWIAQLFLPWQTIFALTLVYLFNAPDTSAPDGPRG